MNEGIKTGVFWAVSAVMLAAGVFMAWPASTQDDEMIVAGKPIFEKFKDPLEATSLKIVTFDEEQGKVATFEVRRDSGTGEWTIPSRKGYPADAVEQMKDAANSLVGLEILDVQTEVPDDHEALGVVEPKLEELEVGDVGVGRLVTFKNESQDSLASVIIGNPVKDEEGKVYVRRPGQDPVFVVQLDEAALSTRFQDWIEDDLLQLSSIDISEMVIKDYSASMTQRGIALNRNYTAGVGLDGTDWELNELLEYDSENPLADPKKVEVDDSQVLNAEKLNDIKNALDDLKIVDVARKPEGMSENLRADKDLVSDNEALQSLATRGFFPVSMGGNDDFEVLSANGELNVSINDGVTYILRFGNVSGLSDEGDSEGEESSAGVNRYLLVTTRVDEEQFPAPELKAVPQTIGELELMLGVEPKSVEPAVMEKAVTEKAKPAAEVKAAEQPAKEESPAKEEPASKPDPAEADMKPAETKAADEQPEPASKPEGKKEPAEPAAEKKPADKPKAAPEEKMPEAVKEVTKPEAGEVKVDGSGEASGEGQGADDESEDASKPEPETEAVAETGSADAAAMEDDEIAFTDLSDEEKQERLEAEQEKILKENTRMLDKRKDELNAAKRRVSDLNTRFANWYYVIPEETYRELRINRDELLTEAEPVVPDAK